MSEKASRAKVVHCTDVPAELFGDEAPGVKVRLLIDEELDGAPVYNLRYFEVAPGGNTPDHSHPFEHENYVVDGVGQVMIEGEWRDIKRGDVVFVPADVRHQYRNAGDTPFIFLCGVPVSSLRSC